MPRQIFEQKQVRRRRWLTHCLTVSAGAPTKAEGERTFGWTQLYSQRLTEGERLVGHRCTHKG